MSQTNQTSLLAEFGTPIERVDAALAALKAGQGVLVVDDEDRENEGDLIYSAEHLTNAQMALMIRECSGIVCLCLTDAQANQLALPPMVAANNSKNQTAFTVTIEAKEGVTTGVSAADRVTTIKTAIAENAKPEHLARPGHVFPLRAKAGGVLERRGHTEGTVDLMRLAGLAPAGVLCEVTLEDGTMARLPEIIAFGKKHAMPVLTIEDLAQYRLALQQEAV
ncbi:3,4-dihydroxy-2-butanone-4-phosphate synthase [Gallaecimonas mangrovi]|uniref:3,4-dihydroxy-2-butanone-4-phosphate synthase n=1 Tax=Gallaecimonas mangrovi TaxID=2291597 RepID=UPI000E207C1D|nr:3,4-dihydroxy-2-butanone-4-phosphate synthase [Gallaecimonas mangrovi]